MQASGTGGQRKTWSTSRGTISIHSSPAKHVSIYIYIFIDHCWPAPPISLSVSLINMICIWWNYKKKTGIINWYDITLEWSLPDLLEDIFKSSERKMNPILTCKTESKVSCCMWMEQIPNPHNLQQNRGHLQQWTRKGKLKQLVRYTTECSLVGL